MRKHGQSQQAIKDSWKFFDTTTRGLKHPCGLRGLPDNCMNGPEGMLQVTTLENWEGREEPMDRRENGIPQDGAVNHPHSSGSIGAPISKRASTLPK